MHDLFVQDRGFELDVLVFVKNYSQGSPWPLGLKEVQFHF